MVNFRSHALSGPYTDLRTTPVEEIFQYDSKKTWLYKGLLPHALHSSKSTLQTKDLKIILPTHKT